MTRIEVEKTGDGYLVRLNNDNDKVDGWHSIFYQLPDRFAIIIPDPDEAEGRQDGSASSPQDEPHLETYADQAEALEQALADYKGIFAATEAREREHGLRVELYFGCDTLEVMADEIIKLRTALAEALKRAEEAEGALRWIDRQREGYEHCEGCGKEVDTTADDTQYTLDGCWLCAECAISNTTSEGGNQ